MSSLGEAFRTAREARGLTLSDVAESIHIRSVYLAAIEAEDWPSIGAPVYARGFIRTYARFLGLDPEGAVASFAERVPSETPAQIAAAMAAIAANQPHGRGPSVGVVALIVVALALIGFVGYEFVALRSGPVVAVASAPPSVVPGVSAPPTGGGIASAAPDSAAANGEPQAAIAANPTPAGGASATPDPGLSPKKTVTGALAAAGESPLPGETASPEPVAKGQIQVRLVKRSWVRVAVDGKTVLEGIFPAGTVRTFTGKTARVRAGNAGGVDVLVAGRSSGAMGPAGNVEERSYILSQPE